MSRALEKRPTYAIIVCVAGVRHEVCVIPVPYVLQILEWGVSRYTSLTHNLSQEACKRMRSLYIWLKEIILCWCCLSLIFCNLISSCHRIQCADCRPCTLHTKKTIAYSQTNCTLKTSCIFLSIVNTPKTFHIRINTLHTP